VAAGEPLPAILPRVPLGRQVRGLHKVMPRQRLDRALRRFRGRWERDRERACRRLFLELLWPIAARQRKPGLVEMTTSTTMHAATLVRLFPEARFVHILRDGRDSGASKVSKRQRSHHPRSATEGFEWWVERLERIERGVAGVDPGRILHLSLDRLVAADRETAYASLLGFLGMSDEREPRRFFDEHMSSAAAHRERWREGLSTGEQRELTRRYEAVLDEIAARGFATAPALRDAYERLG
jgi:hypothetical protein